MISKLYDPQSIGIHPLARVDSSQEVPHVSGVDLQDGDLVTDLGLLIYDGERCIRAVLSVAGTN